MRNIIIVAAFLLSALMSLRCSHKNMSYTLCDTDKYGSTIRIKQDGKKEIFLIFTADSMFEGGTFALDILKENECKASFFFTGNFLRDSLRNGYIVNRVLSEGHYLGPHGDKHILLADWDDQRRPLATPDSAVADMRACIERIPASIAGTLYVVPSFEWCGSEHTKAFREAGMTPLGLTPGFLTYRDYTTPDMMQYASSDSIWNNFIERLNSEDISGSIVLIHLGTSDLRTDKFYDYLPRMIDSLRLHGYNVNRLP